MGGMAPALTTALRCSDDRHARLVAASSFVASVPLPSSATNKGTTLSSTSSAAFVLATSIKILRIVSFDFAAVPACLSRVTCSLIAASVCCPLPTPMHKAADGLAGSRPALVIRGGARCHAGAKTVRAALESGLPFFLLLL